MTGTEANPLKESAVALEADPSAGPRSPIAHEEDRANAPAIRSTPNCGIGSASVIANVAIASRTPRIGCCSNCGRISLTIARGRLPAPLPERLALPGSLGVFVVSYICPSQCDGDSSGNEGANRKGR